MDGCAKACAKRGTEMHSGPVGTALIVSEILASAGQRTSGEVSGRRLSDDDRAAVALVAERVAGEVDRLGRPAVQALADLVDGESKSARPAAAAEVVVDGRTVSLSALPLILARMADAGLPDDDACGGRLLAVAKVYHPIVPAEEGLYAAALVTAYRAYLVGRPTAAG